MPALLEGVHYRLLQKEQEASRQEAVDNQITEKIRNNEERVGFEI
jgi:hypothetical protein